MTVLELTALKRLLLVFASELKPARRALAKRSAYIVAQALEEALGTAKEREETKVYRQ